MKIKDMHFSSKPSYKLINNGVSSLDTAELLAIVLGSGGKESVLGLSHRLLRKYGLVGFGDVSYNELRDESDYVKALRILSVVELSKRYGKCVNNGFKKSIGCSKDVYDMFKDELVSLKKEHFFVLLLDTKNRIIKKELVSVGTLNSSIVHPREVFRSAIRESANSIILIHNHPSGDCEPSDEDVSITERLVEIGCLLDVSVLDHVVVGLDGYWSWKES